MLNLASSPITTKIIIIFFVQFSCAQASDSHHKCPAHRLPSHLPPHWTRLLSSTKFVASFMACLFHRISHYFSFDSHSIHTNSSKQQSGNALGDAVGLSTEFLNKEQAVHRFGDKIPFPVPESQKTGHSTRWTDGESE